MACQICKENVCLTRIEHLGVRAGNLPILEDVNLHLHCGELTAIVGRNGAGKTTFLKALLNEIPHTGTIIFEGENGKKPTTHPRFGYVPQKLFVEPGSPVTVEDVIRACLSKYPVWLPPRKKDRELVQNVLSQTHTEKLINRRIGDLSGGELQRVMLALAIHPVPDILLLDEPVSGVDRSGLKLFYELVSKLRHEYDITILLISHDLDIIARHADRVVLINHGVAANGTVEEVYNSAPFIETFGHIVFNKTEHF
ncbi:MAG: metal ABC transporter ATP-binding protein [Treponema sp.]|nr:metal ABC transporter ATP-binding protein [Treponema sp.]